MSKNQLKTFVVNSLKQIIQINELHSKYSKCIKI